MGDPAGACPWEEGQDEAFQAAGGVAAVLQSQGVLRADVRGHEGHGEPAASETSLDGASRPVGMGEDASARVQGAQPLVCQLRGAHVLQPLEAWAVGAWLGGCQVEALQEAALGVGKSQEVACLVEGAQTPTTTPRDWGLRAVGARRRRAGADDQPERAGFGPPGAVLLQSRAAPPWSPS